MREKFQRALPLLITIVVIAFLAHQHYGEKPKPKLLVIPERFYNIRSGDWFRLDHQGKIIRQLATGVRGTGEERKVRYRLDYYDQEGNLERSEERELTAGESLIRDANNAVQKGRATVSVIETTIGGKKVAAYRTVFRGGREIWFSDKLSINGIIRYAEEESEVVRPLDFGHEEPMPSETAHD